MIDISAFTNRFRKKYKHLKKWAKTHDICAWRIYNRDIPQFPFAIDIYNDHLCFQEYRSASLEESEDFDLIIDQCVEMSAEICGIPMENVHYKLRQSQKGKLQYEKGTKSGQDFIVREGHCQFLVNLDRYLDTGLFLDHRALRMQVGSMSEGKRFLNLFAYTSSFTVHAARGGAVSSVSVDLSKTYTSFARENFALNGIDPRKHRLIASDVFDYLKDAKTNGELFDLIVMDPPSFSNSKKMIAPLDIKRDAARLIDEACGLLSEDGVLYFSTNLQSFAMRPELEARHLMREITYKTVSEDFKNARPHRCWEIKRQPETKPESESEL